jgi:hypothetical protein
MSFKFLLPLLFEVFRGMPRSSSSPISNESLLIFKKNLNREVSALIFKFFAGVILTALVIMALSRLLSAAQLYIGEFQNSPVIEMITFGLLTLVGCGLLVFLFLGNKLGRSKLEEVKTPPPADFDLQNIFYKFVDGVSQGFEKHRQN